MMDDYAKTPEGKKRMAEVDLSTLIEAEKIKSDKTRMAAVRQCKKEKMAAMEAIDSKSKGA